MRVLPFTIPVQHDHTIIVQEEELPYFYTHLHRHEEIQLTWVIEGKGTLIAGNDLHPFQDGDIFFLGRDLPHVFRSDPAYFDPANGNTVQALTLFFNPNGKLGLLFDLPELKIVRSFVQRNAAGFRVPQSLAADVAGRMCAVRDSQSVDQLVSFLQLMRVFSHMPAPAPLTVTAAAITDNVGVRIAQIYNFIIQNFDKPLTLDEVSEQAYMTPQAFCRYFKKHTRQTFVGFLNRIRINEACKLLNAGGNERIATVAYDCGFSSITNFNRVFKMVVGEAPSAYVSRYSKSTDG